MSCRVDWWCPNCSKAASFRGTGKFQFGLWRPMPVPMANVWFPETTPVPPKIQTFLKHLCTGDRLVTRRRHQNRRRLSNFRGLIQPLSQSGLIFLLGSRAGSSGRLPVAKRDDTTLSTESGGCSVHFPALWTHQPNEICTFDGRTAN